MMLTTLKSRMPRPTFTDRYVLPSSGDAPDSKRSRGKKWRSLAQAILYLFTRRRSSA
jgi:hypothetical protein